MGRRLVRGRFGYGPDALAEALGRLELSELSRRRLIGLSAAGLAGSAAAVVTSGCGEDEPTGSSTEEAELLNDALALELSAIFAYETGAAALLGDAAERADGFAKHASEHADLLREEIEGLGGTPVEERSDEFYRRDLALDELDDAEVFLNVAADLSNMAVGTYIELATKLTSARLRRTAFEIAAVEAQQISVVLGELGEPQVPDALVVGAQP